jgi:Mn-dependent DtxR family transcriptional regulator
MQERKIVMTKAELRYLMAIDMLYDGISGVKLTEIAAEMAVTKVSVYRAMERL